MKTVDSTEPNYKLGAGGIHLPLQPVQHIDGVYEESGFETLREMQERHFWYRGRHRILLTAVNRYLPNSGELRSAIDLGGGVSGWVRYLAQNRPNDFGPPALADSSTVALAFAESVLPNYAQRFNIDLMKLNMSEQWNVAFLLDVIDTSMTICKR